MFSTEIYLRNLNEVRQFVDTVSLYPKLEVYLVSDTYTMDAHSLIGILTLHVSSPVTMEVSSDNIPESFWEDIRPYVYNAEMVAGA